MISSQLPPHIPRAATLATLISLTANGTTGAITAAGTAVFDLVGQTEYHEGSLIIEALSVNGQGATPTTPGAAKTYTVYYAFCNASDVVLADAPTVLDNLKASLTITLPNSAASTAAGTRYHQSSAITHKGRYLYVWYDRDAFGSANAKVNLTVTLVRL